MTNLVLIVTGSYPPEVCGVGDYVERLETSMRGGKISVAVFHRKKWSLGRIFRYRREIRAERPSLVHFQYPTEGYGYSFLPMALMFGISRERLILTLHEYSSRTWKAKLVTFFMAWRAGTIVVTNQEERQYILGRPFLRKKDVRVISIGSNIPASAECERPLMRRSIDIAYFGHIRPIKGIEDFISCVRTIRDVAGRDLRICIIGQTLPKYAAYFKEISGLAGALGIELLLNQGKDDTALCLSDCKIAYLPFIDGISSRRGSLAAACLNGCAVVSTLSNSDQVNGFFGEFCYLTQNVPEAAGLILSGLDGKLALKSASGLASFFSWEGIAAKHMEMYTTLLNKVFYEGID